ncbi:MAG: NAD-dependent epimerase/dehydratase family protein [Chloroflexi bacterium]|nr:NAD-dependent epimerase/dehydratase family protein [Chloroflexota bacterium]
MDILIIGGTQFVGRAITEELLSRNHNVTLFHRGKTNPDLFDEAEHLTGNRDGDLVALEGRQWDAVIDTCGYVPRVVEQSAKLLQDAVKQYLFISTISVYANIEHDPNTHEDSPLATLEDETTEEITGETYGGLKVLCENVVMDYYPDHHIMVRPGLIVGPHDHTHRFAYWILRGAAGGTMLAPGDPEQPMQFIDVRDLARLCVDLLENEAVGIFNATGTGVPLRETLSVIREVTNSNVEFQWVDEQFLVDNEVIPWQSLPLWVPSEMKGIHTVKVDKALAAGLTLRPVREIVADSYRWLTEEAQPASEGPLVAQGTLTRERESELLEKWQSAFR